MTVQPMVVAAKEPVTGDVLAGRYRLERRLGEGGMGVVWEARQLATDKVVALKVLKDQDGAHTSRFAREAKLTASLSHRNIVQVFDYWEAEGSLAFLVMELLEGRSLAQELEIRGAFSVEDGLRVLNPVIEALAYAHERGIIHRDLKPENVFIAGTDVKLLDFGLAKRHVVESDATIMTQSGAVMGTPHYMSPEQIFGASDLDARADVWALGVLAYEVLSGQKPFLGDNFGQVFHSITQGVVRPLKEAAEQPIPHELNELVLQMLEKDRGVRPKMSVVARKFASFSASSPIEGEGADKRTVLMARTAPLLSVPRPLFGPPLPLAPSTGAVSIGRTLPPEVSPASIATKAPSVRSHRLVWVLAGVGALAGLAAWSTFARHESTPVEQRPTQESHGVTPAAVDMLADAHPSAGQGVRADAGGLMPLASGNDPPQPTRSDQPPRDRPQVATPSSAHKPTSPANAGPAPAPSLKVDPLSGGRF